MKTRKIFMLLIVLCLSLVGCRKETAKQEEEQRIFQIQREEGIFIDGGTTFPFEIRTQGKATKAFNEPLTVQINEEQATINFSFTNEEKEVLKAVKDGVVIETGETMPGVPEVSNVGDIATFRLQITKPTDIVTILYEFEIEKPTEDKKGMKSANRFLALRVEPTGVQAESATEVNVPEETTN